MTAPRQHLPRGQDRRKSFRVRRRAERRSGWDRRLRVAPAYT